MEENPIWDVVVDLDLNHQPLDPPPVSPVLGFGSFLSRLESTHEQVQERIRQLEAVTARARQRESWRLPQYNSEPRSLLVESVVNRGNENELQNQENAIDAPERIGERGKGCKRDSSHLVAKALEIDSEGSKINTNGGNFYDCNVCLSMAKEPILTCCGHLFCWSCFYQIPCVDSSTTRECTICKGEVTNDNIIPIYVNGNSTCVSKLDSGSMVPPRPRAQRIESVRQQQVTRRFSHIPVAEALRRIRASIGAMAVHPRRQDFHNAIASNSPVSENVMAGSGRNLHSRQFSRVFSESAASLTSISSALNSAERLVEDLEMYINDQFFESDSQLHAAPDVNPSNSSAAVMQPEHHSMESTVQLSPMVPISSLSRRLAASVPTLESHYVGMNSATDINQSVPPAPSRRSVSGISNLEAYVSRDFRRRRLR